jgi:hypothetical protein
LSAPKWNIVGTHEFGAVHEIRQEHVDAKQNIELRAELQLNNDIISSIDNIGRFVMYVGGNRSPQRKLYTAANPMNRLPLSQLSDTPSQNHQNPHSAKQNIELSVVCQL